MSEVAGFCSLTALRSAMSDHERATAVLSVIDRCGVGNNVTQTDL